LCNLYSFTKGQQAIRDIKRAMIDRTEGSELVWARFGMPPAFLAGEVAVLTGAHNA
jgi:hypothetical protein